MLSVQRRILSSNFIDILDASYNTTKSIIVRASKAMEEINQKVIACRLLPGATDHGILLPIPITY